MKTCSKCQKSKSLDEFNKHARSADGLSSYCTLCANEAGRLNYQQNKERYFNQAKARDAEMRDKIRELKSVPCADCKKSYDWVCMDFDHLPEFEKSHNISYMMRHRMAWSKIEAEIAKCEVVCANCHRIRSKQRWLATGEPLPVI